MNPKEEQLCDQQFLFRCQDDFFLLKLEDLPNLDDIEVEDDKFNSSTSDIDEGWEIVEYESLSAVKSSPKENIPTVDADAIGEKSLLENCERGNKISHHQSLMNPKEEQLCDQEFLLRCQVDCLSPQKPEDLTNLDGIKAKKLEFIRPVIPEPPGELSSAEIKKEITSNASNKDVSDWVKTDIKDMTCVFEHTDNVYATDREKGKYRFALICKHVGGKDDLQIQTMYAAQDFANKPNYPNGLLKQLCDYLHDENIISQELQEKGKSVDAGEQEGQGVALFSINSLLEEESESESSSEDEL